MNWIYLLIFMFVFFFLDIYFWLPLQTQQPIRSERCESLQAVKAAHLHSRRSVPAPRAPASPPAPSASSGRGRRRVCGRSGRSAASCVSPWTCGSGTKPAAAHVGNSAAWRTQTGNQSRHGTCAEAGLRRRSPQLRESEHCWCKYSWNTTTNLFYTSCVFFFSPHSHLWGRLTA